MGKEFKFPTAHSVEVERAKDVLIEIAIEAKPLVQALIKGAVIVCGNDMSQLNYALADIDENGKIHRGVMRYVSNKEFKNQIKDCPLLKEATIHLDGEWAGADDGMLRRVIFAKTNQAAQDNAYRIEQVINTRSVVRNGVEYANRPSEVHAIEHEIQPRMPHCFCELPLLTVFKYINEHDQTTQAIKVGRSTAITGIKVDENLNLLNVATYNFTGTKVRLKKNTMVVKIEKVK
jgi:hypothetical protein